MTCLTGHVNKPGVYELRLGFPVKQMIEEVGGGIRSGRKLKAFIPGGSSCPVLTAASAKAPPWITTPWRARKTMLGSGGVIIMDDHTCMVKAALRIMRFYAHESCGWCIPCREGTTWLRKILARFHEGGGTRGDIDLIGDIAEEYAGPHVLPAGRRGRHADDFDRREVPAGVRRSSERQAVPVRARARRSMVTVRMNGRSVKLTIDGRRVDGAPPGTLVIDAAKPAGIEIPAFCYYEGLRCRRPAACAWWKWRRCPS